MENRAIVTIIRKLFTDISRNGGNVSYEGIAELSDSGYARIEVALPCGVEKFPSVPYMVIVDCANTFCEYRKNRIPLLTVNEWKPISHLYM